MACLEGGGIGPRLPISYKIARARFSSFDGYLQYRENIEMSILSYLIIYYMRYSLV